MTLTKEEIFARAGLTLPNTEMIEKEHRLLYNIHNIKEHTNNIQEQNCINAMPLGQVESETSSQEISISSCELLDSSSQERGQEEEKEPLDSESGFEATPLGPHNVKRALVQLFKNTNGLYKLKIRFNLEDGDNIEFISPLQKVAKKSNFMKHAPDPELANDFWNNMRSFVKKSYGIAPLLGKFHEKTGSRKSTKQSFTVEPECFGAAWYDSSLQSYRYTIALYDFIVNDEIIDDVYITDNQRKSGVIGQHLWINPKFDTRSRPLTFAERKRLGKSANYK